MNNTLKDYRESHKAKGYGKYYNLIFEEKPYLKYLWETEKKILDQIIKKYYSGTIENHLDFACGTGRIIGHVASYAEKAIGVDISESMLKVAKSNVSIADFYLEDLTKNQIFDSGQFHLITSFRFFLNAQQELRKEAVKVLSELLNDDGYLVLNIHNNKTSIKNILSKTYCLIRYGKIYPRNEMSIQEVKRLLNSHGFKIEEIYNYATFPIFREDRKFYIGFVGKVDTFFSKYLKINLLSNYLIFVCKKF